MTADLFDTIKPWLNFIHPLMMWGLFFATLYVLYLGWQSRRIRSVDAGTRKQLIKGQFKYRHHQLASLLLALVVLGNMGGMGVTYLNNEKLFVDDHLLVGLSMVVVLACAAALVPLMQRGSQVARDTHVFLTVGMVGLFGWEAVTGMEILQRIMDNMGLHF